MNRKVVLVIVALALLIGIAAAAMPACRIPGWWIAAQKAKWAIVRQGPSEPEQGNGWAEWCENGGESCPEG